MSAGNVNRELQKGTGAPVPSATVVGLLNVKDATYGVLPILAYGTTVVADSTAGYAIGCIFIHTDGGDGSALYVNEGTAASCDFNLITVA